MSRNKRLVATSFLPFLKPLFNYNLPKFKIGNYVEYRVNDEGIQYYERGIIVGMLAPQSGHNFTNEWLYFVEVRESNYEAPIGATGEGLDSELMLFWKEER